MTPGATVASVAAESRNALVQFLADWRADCSTQGDPPPTSLLMWTCLASGQGEGGELVLLTARKRRRRSRRRRVAFVKRRRGSCIVLPGQCELVPDQHVPVSGQDDDGPAGLTIDKRLKLTSLLIQYLSVRFKVRTRHSGELGQQCNQAAVRPTKIRKNSRPCSPKNESQMSPRSRQKLLDFEKNL